MMEPIRQQITVPYQYTVYFTENVFAEENPLLGAVAAGPSASAGRRTLVVLDGGLAAAEPTLPSRIARYAAANPAMRLVCAPVVVPGGEAVKNTGEYAELVHRAIHDHGICRQSLVIAVGGGAVLDMAGYAAATAHRGIPLLRIPTTVLSQNDSGVGVKNGINAYGIKNFLGAFAPPCAVINDSAFLRTLGERDWRSGIAEAVKVALIRSSSFFDFLERVAPGLRARELQPMQQLIARCAELHLAHIRAGGDPFETGSSRPLDFGHWAAHKLEAMSGFHLRHGEAVAIGIALDATYSQLAGLLTESARGRIVALLEALGFDLAVPELHRPLRPVNRESLLHGLDEFREHLGGALTVTLLEGIGSGVEVHEMDHDRIAASVRSLLHDAAQPALERKTNGSNMSHVHAPDRGRILHREPC